MNYRILLQLVLFGSLACSHATLAHHSFAAQYDANKPLELEGTVTKFDWMNPHAHFYVDVKDKEGHVINWNFEIPSPNVLKRQGWSRTQLKVGDSVKVKAFPAKNGTNMASASVIRLKDGSQIFGREGNPLPP